MQRTLLFILQPSKPPRLQEGGQILLGGKEDLDAAGPQEGYLAISFQGGLGLKVKNPVDSPGWLKLRELRRPRSLPPYPHLSRNRETCWEVVGASHPQLVAKRREWLDRTQIAWPPMLPKELRQSQDANFCGHLCVGEGGVPQREPGGDCCSPYLLPM